MKQLSRLFGAAFALLCACARAVDYTPASLEIHRAPAPGKPGVVVTFVGTTTALISDGETSLLTDGYFSRVKIDPNAEGGGKVRPDMTAIRAGLAALDIRSLSAVLVLHSHFDHAMDAPVVAALTGAELVGSESTANVGRGLMLPEKQIRVVAPGQSLRYGKFVAHFHRSKHWPLPEPLASAMLGKSIDAPLTPPARIDAYKEGVTWTILLEHPSGNLLIQGSAGYLPGALSGVKADAILLGTGGLGDLPRAEQEAYYREVVSTTGARAVYPIHWDVMSTPLTEPLVPETEFQRSMAFLAAMQQRTGVRFHLLPKGEPVLLFE
jgi:L-ascorbate metabolism protein UlaG (beta-lactamase superfamily)